MVSLWLPGFPLFGQTTIAASSARKWTRRTCVSLESKPKSGPQYLRNALRGNAGVETVAVTSRRSPEKTFQKVVALFLRDCRKIWGRAGLLSQMQ